MKRASIVLGHLQTSRTAAMAEAESASPFQCSVDGVTSVIVLGASGDLAKKKIFPVLWNLFRDNLVNRSSTMFFGYARSDLSNSDVVDRFRPHIEDADEKGDDFAEFADSIKYIRGAYDEASAFKELDEALTASEEKHPCKGQGQNRIFYLALPPNVFIPVCDLVSKHALSKNGWNRVIVEKPFGRDSESYHELATALSSSLSEKQLYRIDHYLGKEMVLNMLILRFSNRIFQPLWNRSHIKCVQISFKEPFGTQGRGGYFDNYGIIRDVMQNHLMQVLTMVAMECPISDDPNHIRDEKVKVLRCIKPIELDDVVIGQYVAGDVKGDPDSKEGYLDDPSVPKGSKTATFATAVMYIRNERWEGVPFVLRCGKALNEKKAEIRIQFKDAVASPFSEETLHRNELVIRVQPKEAMYMKFLNKAPGMEFKPQASEMDLSYHLRYKNLKVPEAYERLILDVFKGSQINFVRSDELEEAWRIFTPLLKKLDAGERDPIPYAYGSRGPEESDELMEKLGYVHYKYDWSPPSAD
eukprot:m.58591 g.58591  ORF g.58591 m.58591 type:complete len:527 (+) comp12885_c1_seq1:291-1871(+)